MLSSTFVSIQFPISPEKKTGASPRSLTVMWSGICRFSAAMPAPAVSMTDSTSSALTRILYFFLAFILCTSLSSTRLPPSPPVSEMAGRIPNFRAQKKQSTFVSAFSMWNRRDSNSGMFLCFLPVLSSHAHSQALCPVIRAPPRILASSCTLSSSESSPDVRDGLAVRRLFLDDVMLIRHRCNLRQMRDAQKLMIFCDHSHLLGDLLRRTAADSCVDLVKNQRFPPHPCLP